MNMLTNLTMQMQNPSSLGSLPSNTVANPRGDVKAITTRSGVAYDGPTIPPTPSPLPKDVERETEVTKDKVKTTNLESIAHVQPSVVQVPIPEPNVAPKPNPKPLHFDLSFADALLHMPKFASTFKSLLSNKEKLFELANTPLNENCSAVLLKKLPKKLGDPDKFLIPCDFPELDECLALADLGASINLMPLSVWKKLSLLELTPTRMTLELANRSIAYPVGVAEDVFVKVGKFHFPADFIVVDYDVDPRVPLILRRPFLRTARALIDVHGEELILRDGDEQLIFHTDTTSKYPNEHRIESIKMINFIDISCEDNFKEGLTIKKLSHHLSGSTTSTPDSSPSLTPVETSDSLLEEFVDELALIDPFLPGISDANFDSEGDIRGNSVILSNPFIDANDDLTSSDDESPPEADVLEDIESEDSYVSNFDESVFPVTPLFDANKDECFDPGGDIDEINVFLDMDVSTDIEDDYYDLEGDIIYLESLLFDDIILNLPPGVFLDHDPRSLKDDPDNDGLKSMVKVFNSESEDLIFDPGISVFSFYSLEPVVSHRSGTFILNHFVEIPSGEIKVHIKVLLVLWGNRLPIPDGSLPLSSRLKGGGNNNKKKKNCGLIKVYCLWSVRCRCGSLQKKTHSKNNKSETDKSLLDHGRLAYRCDNFQKGRGSPSRNYFRPFLDILENYNPMDDEPMWAADRVVASTLGSAITIPETANEFAIKGNHLTLVKGNQFDGRIKTDPHKHIHELLGICDMFKYRDTEYEVRLMMFPYHSQVKQKPGWMNSMKEPSKHGMNFAPPLLAYSFPRLFSIDFSEKSEPFLNMKMKP
ncbi:reverse transcriptase domain-containing protein [Tanacetum coccineum]